MKTTIDKAGRLVVPKPLRDQYNLVPGAEIEMEPTDDGIRLRALQTGPSLVEKEGVLVHHGSSKAEVDIAEFVRRERDTRSRRAIPERGDG